VQFDVLGLGKLVFGFFGNTEKWRKRKKERKKGKKKGGETENNEM